MPSHNSSHSNQKITVYYDGLCHLCSREINHYKKIKGSENIQFMDITDPSFSSADEGLDPVAIHRSMHVKDKDGNLKLGLDSFITIWGELPALRPLVPIATIKPVYFILSTLYFAFAKVRPLLPRKSCESSPYCETNIKPS